MLKTRKNPGGKYGDYATTFSLFLNGNFSATLCSYDEFQG